VGQDNDRTCESFFFFFLIIFYFYIDLFLRKTLCSVNWILRWSSLHMFIYACKHKLGAYSRMSLIIQKHNIDIN
jgi:hypothetical protein